jgi:hypothetical protein
LNLSRCPERLGLAEALSELVEPLNLLRYPELVCPEQLLSRSKYAEVSKENKRIFGNLEKFNSPIGLRMDFNQQFRFPISNLF